MVDDLKKTEVQRRLQKGRRMRQLGSGVRASQAEDSREDSLGPLTELQGTWTSPDQGWNLIALPFKDPSAQFNYRLLMNQYGETLDFSVFVDENIPNRGITPDPQGVTDQLLTGLDYQQVIHQVASEDNPPSTLRSRDGEGIHHEPGLFLHVMNHTTEHEGEKLTVARLATIPHGDSVLAMGKVTDWFDGPPIIPNLNALPVRATQDLKNPYLSPYQHFENSRFFGNVPTSLPGFPGFFATNANAILQFALGTMNVKRTMVMHFDTRFGTGGIVNIPFIVREANATEMIATFWIMELNTPENEPPEFVMQYSQTVFLDFFDSMDEPGQLIRWPHVSINTMRRA